ncbi:putative Rhs family protein [Vibrio nigripulchritudo SO65]|uniref:RNase A-like domain-containing protein n=1 Tax=Vibrio nigripulchritudo TaxID=28173 RepID=UPI0003B1D55B|nr:RNase A-like domain-containing protein [Vibrio nigripulchritudo]CCN36817.1 putative Rhs family protein [Vibrio nigripulchritudo AM115]CCN44593.1 putative Rhs family protein [Vibrio nigripulchritudo FTn2]CCN66545.1 putative Rhs family protein [Vibrio nigripulchritudo POn4]CCN76189.1 putative Rhs family protein [Vibrio nigripulchritudo SO65]
MIRENFSNTIQRGTEKFTFSSQNQGKGTAKVFQSENEAINFVAQFFSRSDSQSLQLLGELNNVSGFQSLSPLKPEERLPAQAKHLGKLLYQQQLFCSVEVSAPPISSSVPIELEYSEPEEEKRPSDGKAEEEQNENATSDEDTPVSAKEHETGGDPVSMVTGEELLSLDDFTSASGLVWTRHYRSSKCEQSVGLGLGWRHSFLLEFSEIQNEEGEVVSWKFVDDMGDAIEFPPVGKGATSYQIKAGSSCLNHKNGYRVITLPDGNQYKFLKHHEDWKLSQIRENALKQIDLRYSSNGRLIEVQTNGVSDLCCQYDKEGKLVGLRCPNTDKLVVEYDIDEYDHLIGASDQNGLQEKYTYTDSALLLTRQRPSGFTHYFEWQGEGAKAKCVRNFGDEGIYDYRFEFGETESSYQDTLGHTWQFKHDGNGKLLEKVSPEGRKSVWEYDDLGRLSKESEPNGTYKKRYYNEFGQLAAIQHSSGAKTEYQYDSYGVLSAVIHPDGEVSKREVNSLGQLIWSQNPSQVSTQYQYDKKGRLIETASSQGPLKRWWWGEENRIQGIQINHSLIRYSYNAENRVNGLAYPDGMYVTLEHNAHGQLTRQRTFHDFDKSVSREHTYDYDDAGRITSITTPNGSTKFEWGTLNQPDSLIKQDGSGLSFEYDAERNLTAINRSDNASYQLSLSPDGQLIETKGFDGIQNQYAYDDNGQINTVISGQRAIHVEYNQHGDMASISARNEGYFNESHFQHSFGGKLLTASNSSRAIKNQYDPHGLLTEEWQSNYLIQNQYNHQKLCEKKSLPNGDELHFDYSEFGELTGVTYQSQSKLEQSPAKVTIAYDNMARVQTLQYGNAQSELRTYDGLGRLKQQDWGTRNRHYRYDVSDNLASCIDSELGHHHYHYDALSQLTRVKTPDEVFKYRFDSFGNPESEESVVEYDRLTEHGGLRYQYDDQGNQIRVSGGDSLQRREFNALNQLVMVNHNGKLAHYEYDALGRRSKKTTESGTTEFIWQGSQLIGEVSANHYRWYVYLPKSHAPLMLIENGQCFFYQNDHLGTPIRLVNTFGNVAWQASYNPLGQASIDIEDVRNPLRFQGQYFDEESGLHYNLARYYDPYSGRFIQPDPIGLLGGINHYQYAPNPVMWIDPSGLCCEQPDTAVKAGDTDSQPEKRVVYAMGSGNLLSTANVNSPTYPLHPQSAGTNIGGKYVEGAAELLVSGVYNTAVDAVAGLAGLAPLAIGDLETSVNWIEGIQDTLSYTPNTEGAKMIGEHLSDYVQAYESTMESAGDAVLDATGSPLAATLTHKSVEIVGTLVGGRTAMKSVNMANAATNAKGIVSTAKSPEGSLNLKPELDKLDDMVETVPVKTPLIKSESGGTLIFHENLDGHTIRRHVGKTDEQLLQRFETEPDILGSSTYPDLETAQRAVGDVLSRNSDNVQDWLENSSKPRLTLNETLDYEVGRVIPQGATASQPSNKSFVLLVKDPLAPNGYRVHTSFPKPNN